MVTAVRNPADYDGIIAGDPGFHLPKAAIGEMYGAQQFAKIASATGSNGLPDIRSGFTDAERQFVGAKILEKCDALDGAADGWCRTSPRARALQRRCGHSDLRERHAHGRA